MNWTETRDRLIDCGIPAERLAVEWRPGANLTGADLSGADLREAFLRRADLSGADLSGADLSGADLREAFLRRADLSGAFLREADLSGADLREADLTGADLGDVNLRGAFLRRADLSGAFLRGAFLRGADLSGAVVSWQSHDMIAEILRRAAADNPARRMLAGLILISRDWCWDKFLALDIDSELRRWALDELRQWVRPGDHAPEILKAIPPAAE